MCMLLTVIHSVYNFDLRQFNYVSTNSQGLQANYTLVCYNGRFHPNMNNFFTYSGVTWVLK
jgi:hypothetical protein